MGFEWVKIEIKISYFISAARIGIRMRMSCIPAFSWNHNELL